MGRFITQQSHLTSLNARETRSQRLANISNAPEFHIKSLVDNQPIQQILCALQSRNASSLRRRRLLEEFLIVSKVHAVT